MLFRSRLFYVILKTNPPKPSSIRKEVPLRIDAIVMKMLAKNPDDRYQDAGLLVEDLQVFNSKLS